MNATRALALCALLGDAVLSAVLYARLPDTVPVHWNFAGQVDRYGSKLEVVLFGPLLLVGLWALLLALSRVDPRRAEGAVAAGPDAAPAEADGSYWTVIHLVVVMLALLHAGLLLTVSGILQGPGRAVAVGLALLLLLPGKFHRTAAAQLVRRHPHALDAGLGRRLAPHPPAGGGADGGGRPVATSAGAGASAARRRRRRRRRDAARHPGPGRVELLRQQLR